MSLLARYIATLPTQSFEDVRVHFTSKHCRVLDGFEHYMIVPPRDLAICQSETPEFRAALDHAVGTILHKTTNTLLCFGFPKTQEIKVGDASPIEGPIVATEYLGGTLIRAFHDGRFWRLATNGALDAYSNYWISKKSIGYLFDECLCRIYKKSTNFSISPLAATLNPNYTYQFILQHPEVHLELAPKPYIYHVGTYDNKNHVYVSAPADEIMAPLEAIFPDLESLTQHLLSNYKNLGFTFCSVSNTSSQDPRFKILHPEFIRKMSLLGRTSNTCLRYLEAKAEGRARELVAMFPSFMPIADWTEGVLRQVASGIFTTYLTKYIQKNYDLHIDYYVLPIINELHKDYQRTRRRITPEVVHTFLTSQHPKRLNFILNGLGWLQTDDVQYPPTVELNERELYQLENALEADIESRIPDKETNSEFLHDKFMPTILSELEIDHFEQPEFSGLDPEEIFACLFHMDYKDIAMAIEDHGYLTRCITDAKTMLFAEA
jgi:hypothetical protein